MGKGKAGMSEAEGVLFGIQSFSIHDGPGIRTTVFLKGCNLRCPWCHNPESFSFSPVLSYQANRCVYCGGCAQICPRGAQVLENGTRRLDREACTVCGKCAEICPSGALSVIGWLSGVDAILDEALRDRRYYESSGGGITLSGGEPLCQPDFACAILRAFKARGVHTVVETNGTADFSVYRRILPYTDLFLIDYKLEYKPEDSRQIEGFPDYILAQVPNTIARLDAAGAKMILRCPVIPGVNNHKEHFAAISNLLKIHKNIVDFEIMPYHRLGVSKAERIGIPAPAFGEPPGELVNEWNRIIRKDL
jgi:pyruvate formate lyase activating enzyme